MEAHAQEERKMESIREATEVGLAKARPMGANDRQKKNAGSH